MRKVTQIDGGNALVIIYKNVKRLYLQNNTDYYGSSITLIAHWFGKIDFFLWFCPNHAPADAKHNSYEFNIIPLILADN